MFREFMADHNGVCPSINQLAELLAERPEASPYSSAGADEREVSI